MEGIGRTEWGREEKGKQKGKVMVNEKDGKGRGRGVEDEKRMSVVREEWSHRAPGAGTALDKAGNVWLVMEQCSNR